MTNAPPMTKECQMSNDEARSGEVVGEKRKTFDLEERTAKFEEVIRFCRGLKLDAVMEPLVRQIIKSATSVGANYCEADIPEGVSAEDRDVQKGVAGNQALAADDRGGRTGTSGQGPNSLERVERAPPDLRHDLPQADRTQVSRAQAPLGHFAFVIPWSLVGHWSLVISQ
jgi:hypothetical protein